MRLSDLLSKAPDSVEAQVERFLNGKPLAWGKHRMIKVGKVAINFRCRTCDDVRTFMSGDELSCLAIGERAVSIDACMKCAACEAAVEAWFLVTSRDGLYEQAPTVRLERYVDNRRGVASRMGIGADQFDDLLERAQLAYEENLGAGAIVYLRNILETLTRQVAANTGIPVTGKKGGRRPFKDLLEEVDTAHHIIPGAFGGEGYRLFSELSEVVHGGSSEEVALQNYEACRSLVVGTVQHVASDEKMRQAIKDLGWTINAVGTLPDGEKDL